MYMYLGQRIDILYVKFLAPGKYISYMINIVIQCKRKTSDHGLGPANNVLGRRQIVICSVQGPISQVYADFSGLGLHNITWAGEELFLTNPGVW